jgi:alkylation response protein AidB-like acyl-CoA dehydrogenase
VSSLPSVGVFAQDDDLVSLLASVDQVCAKFCTPAVVAGADRAGALALRRSLADIGALGLGTKEGGGTFAYGSAVANRLGAAWAPTESLSALSVTAHLDSAIRGQIVTGERTVSVGSEDWFQLADENSVLVHIGPDAAVLVEHPTITAASGSLGAEWSHVSGENGRVLADRSAIVGALEAIWASYLAGACERMIRTGAEYAGARTQFGRPIGSNQAISHPLAECINAAFAVDAAARIAGNRLSGSVSRGPDTAAAYVAAVRLVRRVCRVVPQTFGAIGISAEGPVSAMLRRLPMVGVVPSFVEAKDVVAASVLDEGTVAALPVALGLPTEVEIFRQQAAAFAEEHHDVHGYVRDEQTRSAVKEVCQELGERGWLSLSWAHEYGGAGKSVLHEFVLWNELAYANVTRPPTGLGVVAKAIMKFGTEDQCREFLPRLRSGAIDIALGYSEPESGSDLGSVRTHARFVDGNYVINGEKRWTSNGHVADYLWLLCRTGAAESRTRGLTILLVDMKLPGIDVSPIPMLDGARLNEIRFTDVVVPPSRRVGAENAAWTIISDSLTVERFVQMPPKKLEADFEMVVGSLSRHRSERDHDARGRVAMLAIDVALVAMVANAAVLAHEAGLPAALPATHAKLLFSSTTQKLADLVLELGLEQLPGADALHGIWLQSLGETLGGGSTEILRTSLAKMEFGLAAI